MMKAYLALSYRNQGLSMVELMVALAISSILLLGISSIFLDSRKTDKLGVSLSRIQETGRFAVNFLAKDIRMAGYQGCVDPESINVANIASNPPTLDLFSTSVRGFEVEDNTTWANGTEFDTEDIEANALIGSDVIAIQGATVASAQPTGNLANLTAQIQLSNNEMGFQQNDIVIIADCESADMFRISNNPGTGAINLAHGVGVNSEGGPKLSALYGTNANIMAFESVAYFVKATGRTNVRGDSINALYRLTDNLVNDAATFTTEELVEGVDSMQILYGERLANGNMHYVPADEIVGADMTAVESIKLGLLISSVERVQEANDNLSYALPGETIAPLGTAGASVTHARDQRIRRDFSVTINLRNRR